MPAACCQLNDSTLNGRHWNVTEHSFYKTEPSVRWHSIFCRWSQSLEQSTHRPQDCYLFNGRFQTSLEDLAFQKSLRLTFRLLLWQVFYQCFYYYHYHLSYHYRCHHCYHHHLMLCAVGLYMYYRRRNRNDCFTIIITIIITINRSLVMTANRRQITFLSSMTGTRRVVVSVGERCS